MLKKQPTIRGPRGKHSIKRIDESYSRILNKGNGRIIVLGKEDTPGACVISPGQHLDIKNEALNNIKIDEQDELITESLIEWIKHLNKDNISLVLTGEDSREKDVLINILALVERLK